MGRIRAVLILLLVAGSAARAQESGTAPRETESWYGWQLFIADGIAVALAAPGAYRLATDPSFANHGGPGWMTAGLAVGGLTATLAGPLLHGAHGHGGRAGLSLAARVLVPLTVAAVTGLQGWSCGDSGSSQCHDDAAMESARWVIASVLLVQVLDGALATERRVVVAPLGAQGLMAVVAF